MRNRNIPAASLVMVFFLALESTAAETWDVEKTKHFIVYHRDEPGLARAVGRRAEKDYVRITDALGFTRHGDFWLWDNRVALYVYPSRETFLAATRAPTWAAGQASSRDRTVSSYSGSPRFLDALLPHELAHLIFREFLNFEVEPPLWLNEGIAQWSERGGRRASLNRIRPLVRTGSLIPLEQLTRENLRTVEDPSMATLFYAQSVSLVDFLVRKYGSLRFRTFCGHVRDGKSVDGALRFTYPESIRNMDALEKAWREYVTKECAE